jgi:hypothetical protein
MAVEVVRAPDHETFTVVKFAVADTDDGGVGTLAPSTVRVSVSDGVLEPAELRATTRKLLLTPATKPSMRAERSKFDVVAATAQVDPLSVLRHTS